MKTITYIIKQNIKYKSKQTKIQLTKSIKIIVKA